MYTHGKSTGMRLRTLAICGLEISLTKLPRATYSGTEKQGHKASGSEHMWRIKIYSLYLLNYARWDSTFPDFVLAVLLRMRLLDPKDPDRDFLNP